MDIALLKTCDPTDISFLFMGEERNISWNIRYPQSDCAFLINISNCNSYETGPCTIRVPNEDSDIIGTHVRARLNSCLPSSQHYPDGVAVDVQYDSTDCYDRNCRAKYIYLPEVKDTGQGCLVCMSHCKI